jgi:hypothetical protein
MFSKRFRISGKFGTITLHLDYKPLQAKCFMLLIDHLLEKYTKIGINAPLATIPADLIRYNIIHEVGPSPVPVELQT